MKKIESVKQEVKRGKTHKRSEFQKNAFLFVMLIPGLIVLFFNSYLPMAGIVMAFQKIDFKKFAFFGKWVGLGNIKPFFQSTYAPIIVRNTLLYNLVFIVLGLVVALAFAIGLNELHGRRGRKVYQTIMFLPYFMSWVVLAGVVTGFLNHSYGYVNTLILPALGKDPVKWYSTKEYWPFILILLNIWKGAGYGSVMYLAGINNIDQNLYEAAALDGASKWQQTWRITLPLLKPLIIILTIMNVGKIFNTDIGLFYTVPQLGANGLLTKAVSTLDTYVYTNLMSGSSVSMINFAAAAAFLQSMVGFVLVLITNWTVRKIDKDYALF